MGCRIDKRLQLHWLIGDRYIVIIVKYEVALVTSLICSGFSLISTKLSVINFAHILQ